MTAERPNVSIIILAAGASSRLGTPKQLLKFGGKTLIRKIADEALSTGLHTLVVLGAETENSRAELAGAPVEIVINDQWQTGMSSSIKCGLSKARESERNPEAVIFLLSDQPLISSSIINSLLAAYLETRQIVVASEYKGTLGVPAIFARAMFEELMNLEGDRGARFLIKKYEKKALARLSVPAAAIDIDTPADYRRLIELEQT